MPSLDPTLPDLTTDAAVVVAYSGGLDSTVLLHLLANRSGPSAGLRAVHIHHGLQAAADDWAEHCARTCEQWQIPLRIERVTVASDSGNGLEAAARDARRAVFAQQLHRDEWLALAHHLDDQAETFLLRALRGSGNQGLAAMRERRDFAQGQLWRPLLQVPRAALLAYAQHHQLQWIEDPSNARDDYDRNFLRLQVMPLLAQRWPQVADAFARSATLAADSEALLAEQDHADLAACRLADGSLSVSALMHRSAPRRARVLRAWIAAVHTLPPLPGNGIRVIEQELLPARADVQPSFAWQQAQIVRWRGRLHALLPMPAWPDGWQQHWDGSTPLPLPDGGHLSLHGAGAFETPLLVRARKGGERIQLGGRSHSHSLKKLLSESDLPPWQRQHLPLLYAGEDVLAAADRIISGTLQQWLQTKGAHLQWQSGPPAN